ncbi:MAG: hypothetical protein AB3N07_10185 [Ruegeria sp.]
MLLQRLSLIAVSTLAPLASHATSALEVDEFTVNCVSELDGSTVTLARTGGTDKGHITTPTIQGEADIYPAGESMTYVLIKDETVVTFVMNYESLKYNMMVKSTTQTHDRGTCTQS